MTNQTNTVAIATEILNQLGGSKFTAMTGSKNYIALTADLPGLRMNLSKNKSGANILYIFLNSDDTYTMAFEYFKTDKKTFDFSVKKVATLENIYADDLQKKFTEVTGLYTRL